MGEGEDVAAASSGRAPLPLFRVGIDAPEPGRRRYNTLETACGSTCLSMITVPKKEWQSMATGF